MSYKNDLKLVESVIDAKADMGRLADANKALVRLEALASKSDSVIEDWDSSRKKIISNQKKLDEIEAKHQSPNFTEAMTSFQELTIEEQKQVLFIILFSEDYARKQDDIIQTEYLKALEAHDLEATVDALNRHNGIKCEFAILNYLQSAFLKNPSFAAAVNCDIRENLYKGIKKEMDAYEKKQESKKA